MHLATRNKKGEWIPLKARGQEPAKQLTTPSPEPNKQPPAKQPGTKETPAPENLGIDFKLLLPYLETIEETRSFILGQSDQAAIWEFQRLPRSLVEREKVTARLRYDLYPAVKAFDGKAELSLTFLNRKKWKEGRMEEYRKAKEGKSGKAMSPADLAREFGIFESGPIRVTNDGEEKCLVTFPGSLLAELGDGTLEVRVQGLTKYVYLGFDAADLVILTRP